MTATNRIYLLSQKTAYLQAPGVDEFRIHSVPLIMDAENSLTNDR